MATKALFKSHSCNAGVKWPTQCQPRAWARAKPRSSHVISAYHWNPPTYPCPTISAGV